MLTKGGSQCDSQSALRTALFGARWLDAVRNYNETAQRKALQPLLNSTAQLIVPTSE